MGTVAPKKKPALDAPSRCPLVAGYGEQGVTRRRVLADGYYLRFQRALSVRPGKILKINGQRTKTP